MKIQNKGAFLVQIAPLFISQPRYQNQSIDTTFMSGFFDMGWLRLVGSWKLQVSFAKELYKRDYILQNRTRILRSLQVVATP